MRSCDDGHTMSSAPFTSPLAAELAEGLLERFQRYVRVATTSDPASHTSPSTERQLVLSRQLADELRALGVEDAALDEHGYVTATVPGDGPVVGLIAHVDTSPEAPGDGVEPIVHREYDGGVIELPANGTRLDPQAMPDARRGAWPGRHHLERRHPARRRRQGRGGDHHERGGASRRPP